MPDRQVVPYLDDDALSQAGITTAQMVAAIESAVKGLRSGEVGAAPKSSVLTPRGHYLMSTLSVSDALGVVVVKAVLVNDDNKKSGLPGVNGAIMALDSNTGQLRAMLDANWITAVRTAGLSALAATRLANPASSRIALIGTGVQAASHLRAFSDLFPLQSVRACGRGSAGINQIAVLAHELGLQFEQADPRQCVHNADIIVSAVTRDESIAPFVQADWLAPGAFATIADLAIPWCASHLSAFDRIYVDDQANERSLPKPVVTTDLLHGDLFDLVDESRTYNAAQRCAFIFRGVAVGDLAVAALAMRRLLETDAI